MSPARRKFITSVCAPGCKVYGVFGSAEVGVFACTNGDEDAEDVYIPVADGVMIELIDDTGKHITTPRVEGTIVATNLVRVHGPRVVRYCMDDRASWVNLKDGTRGLRVAGRAETALSMPLGPMLLSWKTVQDVGVSPFERLIRHRQEQGREGGGEGFVAAQLWLHHPPDSALDAVTLKVCMSMSGEGVVNTTTTTTTTDGINRLPAEVAQTECKDDVDDVPVTMSMNDAIKEAQCALTSLLQDVPNIGPVSVTVVDSMTQLRYSQRSSKIMYFVDDRGV